jgi:hypothetical protein
MSLAHLALAAALTALAAAPALASDRCKVTDPTGTPLNVRDLDMKIVGNLDNGVTVYVQRDGKDPKGKPWAYVTWANGDPIGWVYREFISCF